MEVRGKSRANPKTKIDDVWSRNDMQLARGKATTKNESTALNSRHTHSGIVVVVAVTTVVTT